VFALTKSWPITLREARFADLQIPIAEYSRMMQLSRPRWMSAHIAQFWLQWMALREGLKLPEPAMTAPGSQEIEL
jgi:hypothetical protein